MENKDVNITFKLNSNLIIVAVGLTVILGSILFCVCYNLPIFKKMRKVLKFSLRLMTDFIRISLFTKKF